MAVLFKLGKSTIPLNEKESIILEERSQDGYEWNEVTFKTGEEEYYIGSYYTYNYSSSREWMEYNSDLIVLMTIYTAGYEISDPEVNKMFDIKNRQLVKGTKEELMDCYNSSFKGISKKKTK